MLHIFLMSTGLLIMRSSITLGQQAADVQPRELTVREGEPFQFVCRTEEAIDSCHVTLPSGQGISLKAGVQAQNLGLEYFGDGFSAGQCGLKVQRTDSNSNGEYRCSMTTSTSIYEIQGRMKLIVARPPMAPQLRLYDRHAEYNEGDTLNAECIVRNGRPAANISWFIGDEPIHSGLQAPFIASEDPNKPDVQSVVQNLSRPVSWRDHGKKLRCVAQHIGNTDRDQYMEADIQVRFAPQPSDRTPIELFGFKEGKEGFVNYAVIANPRPDLQWRVDNKVIIEGENNDGYDVMVAISMEMGLYEASLLILNVSNSDFNKDFHLTARNKLGTQMYTFKIVRNSTHESNPGPPMAPKLRLFDRHAEYNEGDTLNAECIVRNGRPAANISWFIGDEPIQSGLQAKSIGSEDPNKPDVQSVAQNLSRPVSWRDHGKKLRCVAQHIGIHNDDADNYRDESLIQVRFAPRPSKQNPIKLYGFEESKESFINYVVIANPRPDFQWRVDNKDIIEGETLKGYEAMIAITMEMGRYDAKLRISKVSNYDFNKDFHLTARNELGTQIYTIRISTQSGLKSNYLVHTIILGTVLCLVFIIIIAYIIMKNLKRNGSTPQPAVDGEVVYDEIEKSKAVSVPEVPAILHAEYLEVLEPHHYDEVREPQPLHPWIKRLRNNRPLRSPRVKNNVDNDGYEIPIVPRNVAAQ